MTMLYDLAPASFRGVRFLCPKDQTAEGRNSILHHYPDSDRLYAEDNGYSPPEFTITAVLHGRDVIAQFRSLRAALNRKGPGTLHHPFYGAKLCAVKGPWKVTREDSDLGVLTLEICFVETTLAIFPLAGVAIPAVVTSLAGAFIGNAITSLARVLGSLQSDASISAMASAVRSTAASFNDLTGAADVSLAVAHFTESAERYVLDPPTLATETQKLFRGAFEDTTYTGEEITRTLRKVDAVLADVAADGEAITPSTLDYAARRSALLDYATHCRLCTLACMADAISGTTYVTADAVEDAQTLLLDTYAAIDLTRINNDLGLEIGNVVAAAMEVLRELELQLPRIESQLLFTPTPASVLAYMLYEDEARVQTLIDLNMDQNPALFERRANILTGVS